MLDNHSAETVQISIEVLLIQPMRSGSLVALADLELSFDGIVFSICGVQLRADAKRTEVLLPKYRAPNGDWVAAIKMPDELREPMAEAVIAAGVEIGVVKKRDDRNE
jgi:stage V sporulation protein G